MKNIILILFVITASAVQSNGQNTTGATQWVSLQTLDVNAGTWLEGVTTLTLYGTERLEWKNQDGTIRKTFLINESIGSWASIGAEGRVQYEITEGNNNGTVTIIKTTQSMKVLIVIASETPQLFELTIQNF
jgi:hypothetical protein